MIIVFGSVNLDIMVQVDALPGAGETVSGADRVMSPGGKGANQALAARRMGADVMLVGAIGDDDFGRQATRLLRDDGVNLSHMQTVERPTGVALIAVNRRGENSIVVSPGANFAIRAAGLDAVQTTHDDILVLQCEVPEKELRSAIAWAKARGTRAMLNLAPAIPVAPATLHDLDALIVNETECGMLAATLGISSEPSQFVEVMARRFELTAVTTLGARGLIAHDGGRSYEIGAFPVEAVDTTAAGDAFVGAFAAAIGEGAATEEALKIASAAGALTCTKPGAQQSLPWRKDVREFLTAAAQS